MEAWYGCWEAWGGGVCGEFPFFEPGLAFQAEWCFAMSGSLSTPFVVRSLYPYLVVFFAFGGWLALCWVRSVPEAVLLVLEHSMGVLGFW